MASKTSIESITRGIFGPLTHCVRSQTGAVDLTYRTSRISRRNRIDIRLKDLALLVCACRVVWHVRLCDEQSRDEPQGFQGGYPSCRHSYGELCRLSLSICRAFLTQPGDVHKHSRAHRREDVRADEVIHNHCSRWFVRLASLGFFCLGEQFPCIQNNTATALYLLRIY